MNDVEPLRQAIGRAFRDVSAERAKLAAQEDASQDDAARAVIAAAEALEVVKGSLAALVEQLGGGDTVPGAARAIVEAAWERLEGAGVRRDGAVGEPIDPSRHRVVGSHEDGSPRSDKERDGQEGHVRVVARVVKPGLRLGDRRIRAAWVVAGPQEDVNG